MEIRYFETLQKGKKKYSQRMEPFCREWDLTQNELHVLLFLFNNPEYDRASDIVTHRGLTKSHVSLSVTNLERRGLLCFRVDGADRRVIHLVLTDQARKIARTARELQREYFEAAFRGVSREELDLWQDILTRVCENIDTMV